MEGQDSTKPSQPSSLEQKKKEAFSLLSRIDFSRHQPGTKNPKKEVPETKQIAEIMPRAGLVYSEKSNLTEVMCKPKILPLKSQTLVKLEKLEVEMVKQQRIQTAMTQNTQVSAL